MFLAEVHIRLAVHRDEVDMGVRHLETENHLCHFLAGEGSLDGLSHFLGEDFKFGQVLVFHVEDIVNFFSWNHQCVTFTDRADIEECIKLVAFCTLVAGDFTSSNL